MTRPDELDAVIVGGGIVGLSVAAALARTTRRVALLERRSTFGQETSSRSSEVVHAGLYYEAGSAKAELCVEGAALTLERAERLGIPLAPVGKLVVAVEPDEEASVEALHARALGNGARGVELWSRSRIRSEEPRLDARLALFSPKTAVIDSHELMRSFVVEAREAGLELAFRHTVTGLAKDGDRWVVTATDPAGASVEVSSAVVVNAAGLGSDRIAEAAGIDVDRAGYRLHPCKGDYFSLRAGSVSGIRRLVYPVPEANERGLGVHLTFDVAGDARLGPDATYVEGDSSYDVEEAKAGAFLAAGRHLFPWLRLEDLAPDRSGIRPKLAGPGEAPRDFVVAHEADRGLDGLVSLVGIESPGLTAAPAIARRVVQVLTESGHLAPVR